MVIYMDFDVLFSSIKAAIIFPTVTKCFWVIFLELWILYSCWKITSAIIPSDSFDGLFSAFVSSHIQIKTLLGHLLPTPGIWSHATLFSQLLCPSRSGPFCLPGFKPLSLLCNSGLYLISLPVSHSVYYLKAIISVILVLTWFVFHLSENTVLIWYLVSSDALLLIFCLFFFFFYCFTKKVKIIPCYSISWSRSCSLPNSYMTLYKDTTFRLMIVSVSQIL